MLAPTRIARWLRTTGYLAVMIAGGFILFLEPFGVFYNVMGFFCLLGGMLSALGAGTGRWGGEYLGLPLIGAAMLAFAGITYRDAWDTIGWVSVPSIALLLAYGILIAARWHDVSTVGRAAREYANAEHP